MTFSLNPVTGIVTISGTGDMWDYEAANPSPFEDCMVTGVSVDHGVTHIGNEAFQYFDSLKSLTVSNGVKSIGKKAFVGCTNLADFVLPDSLTDIGDYAFSFCNGLSEVIFPRSVKSIGGWAFANCLNLKAATVCNPAAVLGEISLSNLYGMVLRGWPYSTAKSFANASGIAFEPLAVPEADFFLPSGLNAIQAEAFNGIGAKAAVIPKKVTSITDNPFEGSGVQVIYGYYSSAADTFATKYGYYFVGIDDAWMASHKP